MSMSKVYTEFSKDIEKYLQDKLPDIPSSTVQEIGAHIGNKVIILVFDMIREHDKNLKYTPAR